MGKVTKQASTRFSIVKRSKGQSAVEKASYISRSVLECEFDGKTYRPKYDEDLVHSEISLPPHAPKEFTDRAILWNSVEMVEKGQKAQLARMLKASLPNDWSYELATEVLRDYVQRNFVAKGMCADWAIHDSENEKGQRNLHFHVLLTMRPLEQDGTWGAKSRKVYILDKEGNKIKNKNGKGYRCSTEQTTDWNNLDNAKLWRKDLADTINATNEQMGIEVHWEHRSFKEQGIEQEPTIHIGAVANALERKGIQTERGNINREIIRRNMLLAQAKTMLEVAKQEVRSVRYRQMMNKAKTEIERLLEKVSSRMGKFALPIASGKYFAKISKRERVEDIRNAGAFLERNHIETFAQLDDFLSKKGTEFDRKETIFIPKWQRLLELKELAKAYAEYAPYKAIYDTSKSLSGLKKLRYDKEHEHDLTMYRVLREDVKALLQEGEKIAPNRWKKEQAEIEAEMPQLQQERVSACYDLAFAEVIRYNKRNMERIEQNECNRQRQSERTPKVQAEQKKRRNEQSL